jgi:fructose-1,6-bisphosphatase/inositol monophosphatase family enzyme
MDLIQLKNSAIGAAREAGKIIQAYMDREVTVEKKPKLESYAAQVVTEVDITCEKIIRDYLRPISEDIDLGFLSEETIDDSSRFNKDYFWCIDPLDGTLAFINKYPGFSVSIALVAKDGTPIIGVVYDPSNDIMYSAVKDLGIFKNNLPWQIKHTNDYLSYVTDKTLSDTPQREEIKKTLNDYAVKLDLDGIKELSGAGSVLNGIRVLENGPACMLKLPKKEKGGGSIWDFAAIACIFQELGLPATNFNGGKLDLNRKEDSFMNQEGIFFGNLTIGN